jgi:imidazolonepropionase-like amidohydrolase
VALVLRDARVWDGVSSDLRSLDVVCRDGAVAETTPPGSARACDDDVELDLAGATVVPGLLDAHVHLVWSGDADPVGLVEREGEQLTLLRAAGHARDQLYAGVTTVRDLGSNWDAAIHVARAVDRGAIEGPTIVATGRTVIMTGGHDPFWGLACDGEDAVVRGVRTQVAAGAGVIKTAATGGVYGQAEGEDVGAGELTRDELRALVGEAHRRGRKVAVHALGTEGIRDAVAAGVDTVEHGVFLTEEIVGDMVRRGTVLCPTVAVYRRIADGLAPDYATAKAREVVDAHRASVTMAREAGVPIIAGTDAGAPGMAHPSLLDEVAVLLELGLTPLEVLRAATSGAADALGLPRVGRVAVGSPADLVVVDGDPLTDPLVLRSPWAVVRHEQVVPRRSAVTRRDHAVERQAQPRPRR